jgi:hypothetical protein
MPVGARGAVLLICVGVMLTLSRSALAPPGGNDPADTITLIGVVRDFEPDHPDFDVIPPEGYGHYMWNVATTMNERGRPVYVGGGYKVLSQAHDAQGRPICWTLCDPAAGDTPAERDIADTGTITSAETFNEWFQDWSQQVEARDAHGRDAGGRRVRGALRGQHPAVLPD